MNKELREEAISLVRKIIKSDYKKPKCFKNSGCVYEAALENFVCYKCIQWKTVMDIYKKVVSKV